MNLRKKIVRLAYENPGPVRDALLSILQGNTRSAARRPARSTPSAPLPRATNRPAGEKFRKGLEEWVTRDMQTRLEAAGVPQESIRSAISSVTGSYGVISATTFSGGYTSQNYRNFATQQEAIDWLAGKSDVDSTGTWGVKRYPAIVQEYITRYGAGNNAIRDKVQAQWNKLKKHQKAMVVVFMSSRGSIRYTSDRDIQEMADSFETMSGDRAQELLPVIDWAAKIPMWPTK